MTNEYAWDFFIAYASPDAQSAERLFTLLSAHARPFMDVHSLALGADWDAELVSAQALSRTTVILVSTQTPRAYYQREEIARAITLSRTPNALHKVVPVFMDVDSLASEGVPYGLKIKHGIVLSSAVEMEQAAERLLRMHTDVGRPTSSRGHTPTTSPIPDDGTVDPWGPAPGITLRRLLAEQSHRTHSALPHWRTAVLFARLGRGAEAIDALEYGDRLATPDDPRRLLYAGFVYLKTQRFHDGESMLRRFLEQPNSANRDIAIAFDLLGTELRRQHRLHEATDRFKSALRLKRKIKDFVGQGITLGNLGRIALYSSHLDEAIGFLEDNVKVTSAHARDSEGIARNTLVEALAVAARYTSARAVAGPVLTGSRFTARDRGFAHVALAEVAISERDVIRAAEALRSARIEFEECAERDGLLLVDEISAVVALANGWRITADTHFKYFDNKLTTMNDRLFAIYRWRRRAMLAASVGDEATVRTALATAKSAAIRAGLPSEDIEADLRELSKVALGTEPAPGSPWWFVYWQARAPMPLAIALQNVRTHALGLFRWSEQACEFVESILLGVLNLELDASERRSFGAKVQRVRTMARQWYAEHPDDKNSWEVLIASLEALVGVRNRVVHSDGRPASDSADETYAFARTVLKFVTSNIKLTAIAADGNEIVLVGTRSDFGDLTSVSVHLAGATYGISPAIVGI